MSIKILMPALSPTMKEGIIQKWLVRVGDEVKAGDVIAEIETDKATMELEAVDEGKDGYLGVKYDKLVPLLIESIKELRSEVEELKSINSNEGKS